MSRRPCDPSLLVYHHTVSSPQKHPRKLDQEHKARGFSPLTVYRSDYARQRLDVPVVPADWLDWSIDGTALIYLGYDFLVDVLGTIYAARPIHLRGQHCSAGQDTNGRSIGIALIGNFEEGPMPAPMRESLIALSVELCQRLLVVPVTSIKGHREIAERDGDAHPTLCPGKYVLRDLDAIRREVGDRVSDRRYL